MSVTPADQLRLLNLAYRQMQADFKKFAPELFRADALSLTADSEGFIYLPTNSFEVEMLVMSSGQGELGPMNKRDKYQATGWYHDGIETTAGANLGKRRIMIRKSGAAWANLAVLVDVLTEYDDLTDLNGTPHPFTQNRYLNMLTELQTFFFHMEGGKEVAKEAEKHWNVYQHFLAQARKDFLHKGPEYMAHAHPDAGGGMRLPSLSE